MKEFYNTKREERLKKNNNFLCILIVILCLLICVVIMANEKVIERLTEQNEQLKNISCIKTNDCSRCNYPVKEVIYINFDDLNKTNPDIYIKNEEGVFVKE
jgi:hypothetical protein